MSDVLLLYLFAQANAINSLFGFLGIGGSICTAVVIAIRAAVTDCYSEEGRLKCRTTMKPVQKLFITCMIVGLVGATLVPTRTGLAIIVGGSIALDVARSAAGQEIATELKAAILRELRLVGTKPVKE